MNSVCIATYNGEKYIKEQLNSILSQIESDDEVIVSDDGSADNTLSIIHSINDSRIRVLYNKGKHGPVSNFVFALAHSKGDCIFLADQDDVWEPIKYSTMCSYLKNFDLVHHDSIVTDEDLHVINKSFYSVLHNGTGIFKNLKKSTYYGSHMAFRREVLETALPFPDTEEIGHDLWIGVVSELYYKPVFIPDKLMLYRRHTDAHCNIDFKSKRSIFSKIRGRIIMGFYIFKLLLFKRKGNKQGRNDNKTQIK